MTESPSKTANDQRLQQMLLHLTPQGAVIPYTICFDKNQHIWVATKGGLFKFEEGTKKLLFEKKNPFPKKIAPYTQVLCYKDKIVYVFTEDKSNMTEFRILSLNGDIEHEHFIDGKIQSLAINEAGDIFLTKQPIVGNDESIIYKSSIDCPISWEELSSSFDFSFQSVCVFDQETLAVATVTLPVNMYSRQAIKWVNSKSGEIIGSFSSLGKEDGQIHFPRCMQRYQDDLLVMDKTGRFQSFIREGKFVKVLAKIDAYIGNGFVLRDDKALVACSGIVYNAEKETICDDWLEEVKLDGSSWVDN